MGMYTTGLSLVPLPAREEFSADLVRWVAISTGSSVGSAVVGGRGLSAPSILLLRACECRGGVKLCGV